MIFRYSYLAWKHREAVRRGMVLPIVLPSLTEERVVVPLQTCYTPPAREFGGGILKAPPDLHQGVSLHLEGGGRQAAAGSSFVSSITSRTYT